MNVPPWLALRQASAAVADGRPDEAHRLLAPLVAAGHRKAWRAARDVARGYCTRARRALDRDPTADAAWRDLLAAESLNTGEKCVAEVRHTLTRLGLVQARAALEAGSPLAAVEAVARLRDRGTHHPDLRLVEEAGQDWVLAAEKADGGDFLRALADLDRLRPRLPAPPDGLDRFRREVEGRHDRFRAAVGRAHEAAEAKRWRDALAAAEDALAAAPEHREARTLRTKAWQAAHPETGEYDPPAAPAGVDPFAATNPYRPPAVPTVAPPTPPMTADPAAARLPLPKRFLLWVDGVAGYLVCTGTRVTFGQAVLGGGPVDVPLFADVSRVHADVTRDGEGYLVESGKAAPVNGKEVTRTVLVNGTAAGRAVLTPGDRVTLGATCQFLFQRPVAVSATARLELTSGHRLVLPVEGVLLMANEVIFGPGPQAHVPVPDLPGRVLLYRSKDGLGVRYAGGKFAVNDRAYTDRAPLPLPASFEADELTFTVEPVGPRL